MKKYITIAIFVSFSIIIFIFMQKKNQCQTTIEGIEICQITIKEKDYYISKSCLNHNCKIKECKEYTYLSFKKNETNYSIPMCFEGKNGIEVELFKSNTFQFD